MRHSRRSDFPDTGAAIGKNDSSGDLRAQPYLGAVVAVVATMAGSPVCALIRYRR